MEHVHVLLGNLRIIFKIIAKIVHLNVQPVLEKPILAKLVGEVEKILPIVCALTDIMMTG
jgi:hypothetical protein